MKDSVKFSIIVPIYNRIDTLDNCINNILSQDYDNYELILVNDASGDGSGELCNKYAKDNDKISVIHHVKNSGAATARNSGLAAAKGDYVIFLDSDDTYSEALLSTLASSIEDKAPDAVVYSLYEEYYNDKGELSHSYIHSLPNSYMTTPEEIHKCVVLLEEETMYGYPWNKAYKRSMLQRSKVEFPVIDHVEDILFNISVFDYVESLVVIEEPLYHYRNEATNRLTDKYLPNYFDLQCKRIWEFLEQQKRWDTLDDYALSILAGEYFRWLMSATERECSHGTSDKEIRFFLAKQFNSMLYAILRDHFRCGGKLHKFYKPLLDKNSKKSLSYAKKVSTVKRKAPELFAIVKQNR